MMDAHTPFAGLALGLGKQIRLHRLLHGRGPEGGRLLVLAADQGLEQGPSAFAGQPHDGHPDLALRLAADGGCSAIVLGIGQAERYLGGYAGRIPLVLKLNGKTDVPPDDEPLAPLNASVEDAVRLGADAVAYTLYAGSPAQFEDCTQFAAVRRDCQAFGMPLLMLAAPRGSAMDRRGGPNSQYALEYGARLADELGADLAITGIPASNPQRAAHVPAPYNTLHIDAGTALSRLVACANRTPLLLECGGADLQDLPGVARQAVAAGAAGLLLRDGAALRPVPEAAALLQQAGRILAGTGE